MIGKRRLTIGFWERALETRPVIFVPMKSTISPNETKAMRTGCVLFNNKLEFTRNELMVHNSPPSFSASYSY